MEKNIVELDLNHIISCIQINIEKEVLFRPLKGCSNFELVISGLKSLSLKGYGFKLIYCGREINPGEVITDNKCKFTVLDEYNEDPNQKTSRWYYKNYVHYYYNYEYEFEDCHGKGSIRISIKALGE